MSATDYHQLTVTPATAATLASKYYGLEAAAEPLAGEVDFNFRLRTATGEIYTLKISRPEANEPALDFQAALMQHLAARHLPFQVPVPVPTPDGQLRVAFVDADGRRRWLRLQSWVPGRMLGDYRPRSTELLRSWGATCGHLMRALEGFGHPAAPHSYRWNPSEALAAKRYLPLIEAGEQRETAAHFWALFEQTALPALPGLRMGINYNDAHEHNLLVSETPGEPRIVGLIDFGDAVHTHKINELAIACAYAAMGMADPLAAAAEVVRGCHAVYPLHEAEVAVLFPLMAARLLLTVSYGAVNLREEPENAYLQVSQQAAWALLGQWRAVAPAFAHHTFRRACGWTPCPQREMFDVWLAQAETQIVPVVDFKGRRVRPLDLSVGSADLGNNANFLTIAAFERTVANLLEGADFGIGGYGEPRPVYTTDAYEVEGNNGPHWRTVHLGIDVWGPAGTPVVAPLAGRVHSFANNAAERDYGPTIILEHRVSEDLTFYTLYGHLSVGSLTGLYVGMTVKAGQQIATFGPAPENGKWPPHLHFQIVLDLYGKAGDYPGVAFPEEAEVWLSTCPGPSAFVGGHPVRGHRPPMPEAELLHLRDTHLGRSLSVSYARPLHIVRGYLQYLYDTSGRRYLDTVNNVAHVGHEHPRVVRTAQRQMGVLNTNTRYLHEDIVCFAQELAATLPAPLSVVHLVNSGSEANELALRMVRAWKSEGGSRKSEKPGFPESAEMIVVKNGYHGNTGGCIDISSYKFDGRGGRGAPPHTHVVPMPDVYRGRYRDAATAGGAYAGHVGAAIREVEAQGRRIGGFIAEGILSCGGQIVLPEGYLRQAYAHVHAAGGLCIADEVQTGFGRVGAHFWAFELQGVVPDIVTMGKPIGNGHPLAAVVTTSAVAEAFANGMEYFNTFGGNPVSCAIGREVLAVIRDEGLREQARRTGDHLLAGLRDLQSRYPLIGDVRGHGLFLGFELVTDPDTRTPAARQTAYLANRMRELGILMSVDGPDHNVIKIKPPLCFDRGNADFLLEYLERVLGEEGMRG